MKNMKTKKWCKGLICALTTGVLLTGCGKSEAEKAAEYYEKEYGMSQETAKELADAFWGEDSKEEMKEAAKEEAAKEEAKKEFKLYEPLPEMANSKLGDGLVQIHDVLIYENAKMTVKELMDALSKSSEAENYNYSYMGDDIKLDALVEANKEVNVGLRYVISETKFEGLCTFYVYNPTDDYLNLEDCVVMQVEGVESDKSSQTKQCYNVLFAGGIRTIKLEGLTEEDECYEQIMEQVITYDNQDDYLSSQGYDSKRRVGGRYRTEGETQIITPIVKTGMSGKKEYSYYIYLFKLWPADRSIRIKKDIYYCDAEGFVPIIHEERASQESWNAIIEEMKGNVAMVKSVDATTLEYQGKMTGDIDAFSGGAVVHLFYMGTDGKYYVYSANLSLRMTGEIISNWPGGCEIFDSLDEAIAYVNENYGDDIRDSSF